MRKVIYSKFSNERSPYFAIRTEIVKDRDNRCFVRKTPDTDEAENHVLQMMKWKDELGKLFEGTRIEPCPCTIDDKSIVFDFVQGTSLEEILDNYLVQNKYNELFEIVKGFFDMCRKKAETFFVQTNEFVNVFGDVAFKEALNSFSVSNIDMIFSNILIDKEKWYLIDYEWCFDFPIPVEYILYRSLHYYVYTKNERQVLIEKGIFDLLESKDQDMISKFNQMEKHFQAFIEGETVKMSSLYNEMGARNYDIQGMLMNVPMDYKGKNLEIYIDEGDGITQDSVRVMNSVAKGNGEYYLQIPLENNVKIVRIDPANSYCYVRVNKITGRTMEDYLLDLYPEIHHNGIETHTKEYVFATIDPWFMIGIEDKKLKYIELEYHLEPIGKNDDHVLDALCKKQHLIFQMYAQEVDSNFRHEKEIVQYKEEICKYENEIERLKFELDMANKKIGDMEESLSWKLTQPLRTVKSKVVK